MIRHARSRQEPESAESGKLILMHLRQIMLIQQPFKVRPAVRDLVSADISLVYFALISQGNIRLLKIHEYIMILFTAYIVNNDDPDSIIVLYLKGHAILKIPARSQTRQ